MDNPKCICQFCEAVGEILPGDYNPQGWEPYFWIIADDGRICGNVSASTCPACTEKHLNFDSVCGYYSRSTLKQFIRYTDESGDYHDYVKEPSDIPEGWTRTDINL